MYRLTQLYPGFSQNSHVIIKYKLSIQLCKVNNPNEAVEMLRVFNLYLINTSNASQSLIKPNLAITTLKDLTKQNSGGAKGSSFERK